MHLSPPVALVAVRSKAVVLSLLIRSWLSLRLWDSVIVQCFVVSYFVSILVVLQSSREEERAEARSTMRALSGAHSTDVRLNTCTNKDRYQNNERPRTLPLLNSHLVALLSLSSWFLVIVVSIFFAMPQICL